jgi:hypothetical protein
MTRLDSSFVRRDRTRPEPSFTAYRPAGDSSSLGTGVLYASGLTLLAFGLAAGWTHGRPTPRRRAPELPAPVWAGARTRPKR